MTSTSASASMAPRNMGSIDRPKKLNAKISRAHDDGKEHIGISSSDVSTSSSSSSVDEYERSVDAQFDALVNGSSGQLLQCIVTAYILQPMRRIKAAALQLKQFHRGKHPYQQHCSATAAVATTQSSSDDSHHHQNHMHRHNDEDLLNFRRKRQQLFQYSQSSGQSLSYSNGRPSFNVVPHAKQYTNWDCGIACIILILRWIRTTNGCFNDGTTMTTSSNNESSVSSSSRTNGSESYTKLGTGSSDDAISMDAAEGIASTFPEDSTLLPEEVCERQWMLRHVGSRSIWTADLVLLLHSICTMMMQQTHEEVDNDFTAVHDRNAPKSLPSTLSYDGIIENNNDRNKTTAKLLFSSKTFDVNDDHGDLEYYQNAFNNDQKRVRDKFRILRDEAQVLMASIGELPFSEVIQMVSSPHCVAIMLIDNSRLHRRRNVKQSSSWSSENQNHQQETVNQAGCQYDDTATYNNEKEAAYAGHYVLLTGISTNKDHIQIANGRDESEDEDYGDNNKNNMADASYCCAIVNPGTKERLSFVSPRRLLHAWRSPGTDNDIVFVVKEGM
eukprot:CAMPEP_0119566594 /NCGR_PEP_ID=MMETSP1352-20130426/33534_1 /TAXON_ID=265584 /ORGANISM="Stauroneis constricta, Strain CCMP1120" /LENGTH=556 /DNA_ID=CAMNT_0007615727 /DNA_START=100 /DNA_END=1770 /DNA_ORIENTATION=-